MKAKHNALLQEYHAEQQQQQQQQQQEQQQQQQLTLLTASELSEVKVWDAFFDATLQVGVCVCGGGGGTDCSNLGCMLWRQPAGSPMAEGTCLDELCMMLASMLVQHRY